jgi:hypothetical protein
MAVRHPPTLAMVRLANRAAGTASMRPSGAVFGSARVLLYTLLCRPRKPCNLDHLSVTLRCLRAAPAMMPACWPASPPAFRVRKIKHLATQCARVHARAFARDLCPHAGPSEIGAVRLARRGYATRRRRRAGVAFLFTCGGQTRRCRPTAACTGTPPLRAGGNRVTPSPRRAAPPIPSGSPVRWRSSTNSVSLVVAPQPEGVEQMLDRQPILVV